MGGEREREREREKEEVVRGSYMFCPKPMPSTHFCTLKTRGSELKPHLNLSKFKNAKGPPEEKNLCKSKSSYE